ncbi:hypothetical protein SAMN05444355_10753 [Flavobacterium frigoris]|uniref:Uncharacterized protein n=1 Tax=Flavobacterium frigoris TaxID=229204 RepID=A0A1H9LK45_FLAFI|nr:hypothetical protein SAMN05444355_10753 [Flavobacterium frigoris]
MLLIPTFLIAQNKPDWEYDFNRPIGAFFPNYFPMTNKYMPAQNTYYEYNWVSNNMQNLIHSYFKLHRNSNDINGDDYIINTYKTTAGSAIDNLKIKYNLFQVYGLYVVSSLEVTGSKVQVIKLFIYLYNNELQSANLKNGFIKTMAQDVAIYSIVNGVASIKITNGVYKNSTQFKTDFEKRKEKFKTDLMLAKLEDEQRKLDYEADIKKRKAQYTADSIARKQETIKVHLDWANEEASKPKESINVFYFKKSGKKIAFKNQPSEDLEKLIIEKTSDSKNGTYSAYVKTIAVLENKSYTIKINPTDKTF